MAYNDKLNEKPIQNEINDGTYIVGVQRNEEGKDVVVRVPATAVEEFKNKNAESAANTAEESAKTSVAAAKRAEAAASEAAATVSGMASKNDVPNAVKGTLLGAAVAASDVSPNEHDLSVKVSSKNLFKSSNTTKGSLDTANETIDSSLNYAATCDYIQLKAGTYTLSCKAGANLRHVVMYDRDKNQTGFIWSNRTNPFSFTLESDCFVRVDVERSENAAIENFDTFFNDYEVQMVLGSSVSAYTPYVDVEGVTVNRFGKNLINVGEVNILTSNPGYKIVTLDHEIPAGTYRFSGKVTSELNVGKLARFYSGTTSVLVLSNIADGTFERAVTLTSAIDRIYLYSADNAHLGAGHTATWSDLQLEIGDTATEYEPYIEPVTAVADAAGNVTGLISASPNMTLTSDTENVIIECEYNRDLMKVIEELTQAIISLGGNI